MRQRRQIERRQRGDRWKGERRNDIDGDIQRGDREEREREDRWKGQTHVQQLNRIQSTVLEVELNGKYAYYHLGGI